MSDIYVATRSATVFLPDGKRVKIIKDVTRVRAGHPLLHDRESLFKPIDVHFDVEGGDVEQATAAPGEKRATRSASRSKQKQSDQDDDS